MTRLGAVPQEARARARLIPLRGAHYPWPSPIIPGRTRIIPRWDAGTLGLSPQEPPSESLQGVWFSVGKLKIVVNKMPFHILHIRGRLVG